MIKVVIVEDEIIIRRGLALTVPWDKFGCVVVGEARNGLQGKKMIDDLKPDIVITDVRMPKLDGINMIRQIVEEGEVSCEFIIISGYSEFEYAQQAVKLGVRDYLLKPVDDKELENTIKNLTMLIREKKKDNALKNYILQMGEPKLGFFREYISDQKVGSKQQYVLDAIEYINKNYTKDINIKDVAEYLALSESYLSRLFKKETGYTFVEYLTNYRIKIAIELLKDHRNRVYEVAQKVGFNDSRYFSTIFKKYVGLRPTDIKEIHA